MSGLKISATLDRSQLDAVFARLVDAPRRPLMAEISAYMLEAVKTRFAFQVEPDGTPWLPLKPATVARKKTSRTLWEEGNLENTLRMFHGDDVAGVAAGGPGVRYAAIHQFGGTPEMPAAPRSIPARPYLGLNDVDIDEIVGIAAKYLQDLADSAAS